MAKIRILMATYIDEKNPGGVGYLREQISSLFQQAYQDWNLVIRDDGSTDEVRNVIEDLAAAHPDKISVIYDHGDNRIPNEKLGPSLNFGRLMEVTRDFPEPYVMFSDQDDIWYSNKIEITLEKMRQMECEHGTDIPLLVHTDFRVVDSNKNELAPSLNHVYGVHKERSGFSRLLVQNVITGMTMMMNKSLVEKSLPIPADAYMHDSWVGKVASLFGKIEYIDIPLVQYRQHANNVLGCRLQSVKSKVIHKIQRTASNPIKLGKDGIRQIRQYFGSYMREAGAILDRYRDDMKPEQRMFIETFLKLPRFKIFQRAKTIWRAGFFKKPLENKRLLGLVICGAQTTQTQNFAPRL